MLFNPKVVLDAHQLYKHYVVNVVFHTAKVQFDITMFSDIGRKVL
jgi:hypothetical protein